MDDMCTACLCTGRKLYFIGETGHYHLYSQILNEIPVYDFSDVCVRVCWECRAVLRRLADFKALVKRSYVELLQQVHQNIPPYKTSLARSPQLQIQHVMNICYPDAEVKEESSVEDPPLICLNLPPELDIPPTLEELPPAIEEDNEEVKLECEAFDDDWQVASLPVEKTRKSKSKKAPKEKAKKPKVKVKVKKKKPKPPQKKKKKEELPLEDSKVLSENGDCDNMDIEDGFSDNEEKEISTDVVENCEKVEDKHRSEKPLKPNGKITEKKPELVGGKTKCGECGKMFSSMKTYRYHLNTLHKGQNRYPCPRCGKVYQWKSNLGRHLRSHKAVDAGELQCAPCGRSFASVATYRQHLRVSRRHVAEHEYNFECAECGKRFVNKTRLRDHVDWEHLHNVKFRCQLCDKPFKCHTSLYVHMQNVHRNKKKENLCHICGKSYQNAAKLKYHIVAMHTSETPYTCAQCGAAFGWYSSLYRHTREVHHQMKLQPKKSRKPKRDPPTLLLMPPPLDGHHGDGHHGNDGHTPSRDHGDPLLKGLLNLPRSAPGTDDHQ